MCLHLGHTKSDSSFRNKYGLYQWFANLLVSGHGSLEVRGEVLSQGRKNVDFLRNDYLVNFEKY